MSATSPLRWGLISTASVNEEVMPGLQRSSKNDLVAVASRDETRAQAFADANDIPQAVGGYDTLLADPAIDCVYISLPNNLHAEWTRRAIMAGKHVLCEKPLVSDPAEAADLFELAADHGVHLAEAFMYRHHPKTHALKSIVQSGELGQIHTIKSWFTYPAQDPANDIRFQPGLEGGALRDVGSYPVSMINFLLDAEPLTVWATQVPHAAEVDTRFYATLQYPEDVLAAIDCSMVSHLSYGVTVLGSHGCATLASPWYSHIPPVDLELSTSMWTVRQVPAGGDNAYFLETEHFADVVAGRKPPEISANETIRTVRTLKRLKTAALHPV